MTEAERIEARDALCRVQAALDAMREDIRAIQRGVTMIELNLGIIDAVLEARAAGRAGLPGDPDEA
jgi:hypothetical protein